MSYTHLSFQERTALMLEHKKQTFHPENLLNKLIDIIVRFLVNLISIRQLNLTALNPLHSLHWLDEDVVTENLS